MGELRPPGLDRKAIALTEMKAVFTTKSGSGYDDIVEKQYHFPGTYLAQVENAAGDEIIYYEPRRQADIAAGGRQAYFAMARLVSIESDPMRDGHYYARLEDFLDFDTAVPFRTPEGYFESMLQRPDGETNKGAFGRSVRNISNNDPLQSLPQAFQIMIG